MIDWNLGLNVAQTLLVPIFGFGTYVLRGINQELRKLNGRVIRMEQWQKDHESHDKDRFDGIHESLKGLRRIGS